ncbi:MAG TPA: FIST C-terminal domain-containing protein [Chloroflexota bacterium]|jgi:small ligand-binding sensory domain FIST|nr:FIST C-terminal domain-containing protein [Chloroflexota bacterium]
MGASVVATVRWQDALEQAAAEATADLDGRPDVVLLFAGAGWTESFGELVPRARQLTGAERLIGCGGQAVIGPGREVEDEPALALLALRLPGAVRRAFHATHERLAACRTADDVRRLVGAAPDDVNGLLVLADPFRLDCDGLLSVLAAAYPGAPLIGGCASGRAGEPGTRVFLDDAVYDQGAVGLSVGGAYTVLACVAQGAQPIGDAWTITGAQEHFVTTISNRPALEVLEETLEALPVERRVQAGGNLLVGLAMDEYRAEFGRGDFLIRNLLGYDPRSGALAIGARPRVGQTIQFQVRDAGAADQDLRETLERARRELGARRPVGAILCACNGRGAGLFGQPNHDAAGVAESLGPLPLAGLFCNGEIGPVAGRPYLHGFTASLGLIVPNPPTSS